jgi:tetratricopeptide (TPR) repeat protein
MSLPRLLMSFTQTPGNAATARSAWARQGHRISPPGMRGSTRLGLGLVGLGLVLGSSCLGNDGVAARFFDQGAAAARTGDSRQALEMFRGSATARPSSGTLHNLGNAAWQTGQAGAAVLAWEQALWLDPRNNHARTSLHYARHRGDLKEPDLRWFEVCSSWLPQRWWPWLAAASFWSCLGLLLLPPIFRQARRDWYQAFAAAAAAVFLLCLPAIAGLNSRADLGFILPEEAALRVTPTTEAQVLAYLPSGEPVRMQEQRGDYALIRTRYSTGWVRQDELGLIGGPPPS